MGRQAVIKDVHFVRKRLAAGTVRWYVYAWRGGPQVMWADGIKKPKLTDDAITEIASALTNRRAPPITEGNTLLSLIRRWRSDNPDRPSSPEWAAMSANTKKTWGSALNRIEEKWGKVPLAVFDDTRMIAKVIDWRDSRQATPRAVDVGIDVLRALLKYGMQRGVLRINVAEKIGRLYKNGQRAEIVWTFDDLKAFAEAAGEDDGNVDDAVQLASVTGLRREDLARLTWDEFGEFSLLKKAAKSSRGRRRFAKIPRIPELNVVLERLRTRPREPDVETVLVSPSGKPWNLDTLSKEVARIAKCAGIVHVDPETGIRKNKHLHDVRGSFATRLMTTTNLNDEEIADIMGWSPTEVRRIRTIYVDDGARSVAIGRRIAGKL